MKRIVTPDIGKGFSTVGGTLSGRHVHYYEALARGWLGPLTAEVGTVNTLLKDAPWTLALLDGEQIPSGAG